jgi:hypothetical protein
MDNTILLQILSELKTISDRLAALEREIKKEPQVQLQQSEPLRGSSALAHLNSLGIPW